MNNTHIIHAIDSLHGGGAEISLVDLMPALAARGVQGSIVTMVNDDGSLADRLDMLGVRRISLARYSSRAKIAALRDIVAAEKPDLLHTTLWQSTLTGRLSVRMAGTPVVTTLANSDYGPEHRANSTYGSWSVRALHAADLVTARLTRRFHAISAEVARTMSKRLHIPGDRIQVVYRGRDPCRLGRATQERRLRVRAGLSLSPDVPIVLSVGRLDRQKGVDTTVRASRLLRQHLPDAVLLIAGRAGNASAVVDSAVTGVVGIRLLGHRSDVADLMCAADALSFPSRWEGLGGTLVEAMALRLPIVGSEIAPITETIGSVGWPLVPPDEPAALARELMAVLRGGPGVEARKEGGQSRFLSTFTVDAAADGMLNFYDQALSGVHAKPTIDVARR